MSLGKDSIISLYYGWSRYHKTLSQCYLYLLKRMEGWSVKLFNVWNRWMIMIPQWWYIKCFGFYFSANHVQSLLNDGCHGNKRRVELAKSPFPDCNPEPMVEFWLAPEAEITTAPMTGKSNPHSNLLVKGSLKLAQSFLASLSFAARSASLLHGEVKFMSKVSCNKSHLNSFSWLTSH